jgi:hypothetical protein
MKRTTLLLAAALCLPLTTRAAEPDKPAASTSTEKKPTSTQAAFEITVDTSDVPEMAEYGQRVQKVAQEWYPKLIAMLPSEGFVPAKKVTITIKKDYKGVAAASGNRIVAAQKWFTEHPDDVGAFVHELVHVVQSYGRNRAPGATRPPGWLVEGIADYIRFFRYEPESARPHPNPNSDRTKYDASYRVTGHFLNWAQNKYDKDLVVKLNAACRQGKYTPDLWKQYTGKTVEELGAEWKENLQPAKK